MSAESRVADEKDRNQSRAVNAICETSQRISYDPKDLSQLESIQIPIWARSISPLSSLMQSVLLLVGGTIVHRRSAPLVLRHSAAIVPLRHFATTTPTHTQRTDTEDFMCPSTYHLSKNAPISNTTVGRGGTLLLR